MSVGLSVLRLTDRQLIPFLTPGATWLWGSGWLLTIFLSSSLLTIQLLAVVTFGLAAVTSVRADPHHPRALRAISFHSCFTLSHRSNVPYLLVAQRFTGSAEKAICLTSPFG